MGKKKVVKKSRTAIQKQATKRTARKTVTMKAKRK